MTAAPPPFDALTPLLEQALGSAPLTIDEMAGGASTRRFFRVHAGGRSAVAMFVPPPDAVLNKAQEGRLRWPFLEVRDLLAANGVRVPQVLGEACASGWLLVEDLGETLAEHLEHSPGDKQPLYQQAVRDLARAQRALRPLPDDSVVRTRAFDVDLLRWEIDHFREWALEARGTVLSEPDRATFARATEYLAGTIATLPRGFVHRDYQSRNLMVLPSQAGAHELAWIDFQDAMLGPRVYDLVALLGDSYQTFDRAFIDARLAEFCAHHELGAKASEAVGRQFELVTVQRKLKDAGRFVFIERKKGDAGFLKFVAPTIERVRASLARLSDDAELKPLAELLGRVCPKG